MYDPLYCPELMHQNSESDFNPNLVSRVLSLLSRSRERTLGTRLTLTPGPRVRTEGAVRVLCVETFSWNLYAAAMRNKFQEALQRVCVTRKTWSVSWNCFELPSSDKSKPITNRINYISRPVSTFPNKFRSFTILLRRPWTSTFFDSLHGPLVLVRG